MKNWSWKKSWHLGWIAIVGVGVGVSASALANTIESSVVREQLQRVRDDERLAQESLTRIREQIAAANARIHLNPGVDTCGNPCKTSCANEETSLIDGRIKAQDGAANYCVIVFEAVKAVGSDITALTSSCQLAIQGCAPAAERLNIARFQLEERQVQEQIRSFRQSGTELTQTYIQYANCPTCQREPSTGELIVGAFGMVLNAGVHFADSYFGYQGIVAQTDAWTHTVDVQQQINADYMRYCAVFGVQCRQPPPLPMPGFMTGGQFFGMSGPYSRYDRYFQDVMGPGNPFNPGGLTPNHQRVTFDPFNSGGFLGPNGRYFDPYFSGGGGFSRGGFGPGGVGSGYGIPGGGNGYGPSFPGLNGGGFFRSGPGYGDGWGQPQFRWDVDFNSPLIGRGPVNYPGGSGYFGPNGSNGYFDRGSGSYNGGGYYGPGFDGGRYYDDSRGYYGPDRFNARGGRDYYSPYGRVSGRSPQEDYFYDRSRSGFDLEEMRRREAAMDLREMEQSQWELAVRRARLDSALRRSYYESDYDESYDSRYRIPGSRGPGLGGRVFIGPS